MFIIRNIQDAGTLCYDFIVCLHMCQHPLKYCDEADWQDLLQDFPNESHQATCGASFINQYKKKQQHTNTTQ